MRDFEIAAREYADSDLPLGEYYTEYADAMMDLRLLPEAEAAASKAVTTLEASGVLMMVTEAKLRLARIALLTGRFTAAQELADAAAESARRQRLAGWRDRGRPRRGRSAVVVGHSRLAGAGVVAPGRSTP